MKLKGREVVSLINESFSLLKHVLWYLKLDVVITCGCDEGLGNLHEVVKSFADHGY